MKLVVIIVSLGFLFLNACSNSNELENVEGTQAADQNIVEPNEMDELMNNIDADLDKMNQVQSLLYTKEDHTMVDVTAVLNKNNEITKLTHYFQDGPSGRITRTHFYFKDGAKFASKLVREIQPSTGNAYYSELVTFYDEKQQATSSKERVADFEEYLEQGTYVKAKTTDMSEKEAYKVLNQEKEYAITFQGFVDAGPYAFLIVGENVENGFTSSLSIQTNIPLIKYLEKKGKEELGRPLTVVFERIMDEQGYEMQILMDVQLVDK